MTSVATAPVGEINASANTEPKILTREDTLKFFGGDDLATDVFLKKYAMTRTDGSREEWLPSEMWRRMAKAAASVEKDSLFWEEEFYRVLSGWKMVPQGSIMFALGNKYQRSSCSNCFVVPVKQDSIEGIFDAAKEMAQTYAYRGGVGIDITPLRPAGAIVSNAARTSTGAWSFMDFYSYVTRLIGQHGRRGALMLTIADHHPDLLNFITAKQDLTKVTGANVSIRISDAFMKAVEEDSVWRMEFKTKHEATIFEKPAREIWDLIITCATKSAEPGLLFWDTILRESPSDCYVDEGFRTICTNPCSEIPLPAYDACTLLSMNLTQYTRNDFGENSYFDFNQFAKDTAVAVRFLDNVKEIDLSLMPLQQQRDIAAKGRRIGMGTHGLGDALANLRLRYDSATALCFVDKLFEFYAKTVYSASVELAKEKGAFPIFDANKEKNNPFLKRIGFAGVPRRNISCLTCAPTGSLSCLCQTSSGVEPVWRNFYNRRRKITHNESTSVPKEQLYKDAIGDLWQMYDVAHRNVQTYLKNKGVDMANLRAADIDLPEYFVESDKIDWVQRVRIQATMQKWIDHAISSCIAEGTASVLTTEGLLEIEEFASQPVAVGSFGQTGLRCESVTQKGMLSKINEVYNNGIAPTFDIDFVGGYEISVTPNHKLTVLDSSHNMVWKEAQDLKAGDIVVGRKGLNIWRDNATRTSISELNMSEEFLYDRDGNSKNVDLPRFMSPELGRFLGYMCSDGSVTQNGFTLTQIENNVCDDFESLVESLFGLSVRRIADSRCKNLFSLQANSREVSAWLKWLGLKEHDEIEVPLVVRRSSAPIVKQFVKGLTLDGCASKNYLCVMTSVSKKVLRQTQNLLLNLGIESNIVKSARSGERIFPSGKIYPTKASWSLIVSYIEESVRFIKSIGFAETRKNQEALSKFKRTSRLKRRGYIPDFGIRERFEKEILPNIRSSRLYDIFHSLTSADKQGRLMNRETVIEMADMGLEIPGFIIDPTYTFRTIKSVMQGQPRQTWDISVPDGNSYIANGLLNHNTCNLPKGTSIEMVKKVYEEAYRSGCKGFTVYVEGCRDGVLVAENTKKTESITKTDAPKRPKTLPADVHHITVKGEEYFVLVGMLDGQPYEVFAGKNGFISKAAKHADVTKLKRGHYRAEFDDGVVVEDLNAHITDEEAGITRLLSLSLRHGADIKHAVSVLERVPGDMQNFARSISRALKKHIPDGTEVHGETCPGCNADGLVRSEGCKTCKSCGWSGCS